MRELYRNCGRAADRTIEIKCETMRGPSSPPRTNKIGVLMSSDTLGVLYAFPQNESPKTCGTFI